MLQVNIAETPATDENWYSLDDLTVDALEELQSRTDLSYWFWDEIWQHRLSFARTLYEIVLRESGAVEVGAEKAAADRCRMSLLRKGRLIRKVDDETDLPQEWDGVMPDPKAEDSGSSTTS